MQITKLLGLAFFCLLASAAHAQGYPHEYSVSGFVLTAQAYRDKNYAGTEQSRYKLDIVKTPKNTAQWDFTLDNDPNEHYSQGVSGAVSRFAYGRRRQMIIHAIMHEYDTCEEQVTFHNLDLAPLADDIESKSGATPRFLALDSAVNATTPSGIQITLPAQNIHHFQDMFSGYNGNPNALFIRIETTPNQKLVVLLQSPLYKKYPKPVHIALDCPAPNYMVWYMADNTFTEIAVGLPELKTVMHLDSLTLIVRQRVDLRSVPVTLTVPIDRAD